MSVQTMFLDRDKAIRQLTKIFMVMGWFDGRLVVNALKEQVKLIISGLEESLLKESGVEFCRATHYHIEVVKLSDSEKFPFIYKLHNDSEYLFLEKVFNGTVKVKTVIEESFYLDNK